MSLARWALVCVPLVVLLGFLSSRSVPTGNDNRWYSALVKPALTPPDWLFPVAWSTFYIMIGFALAMILNARGARGRGLAVALFAGQLGLNLAWSPLFFGAHLVGWALLTIVGMLLLSIATTFQFARIRRTAAWLMVPYLVWLSFATGLNWRIGQLNPDAETLVPGARTSQVIG
ncbi:TspO/MBR family protein [Sphingomonas radiodurans]|uniref:TspO/MBR family protein n=1 Tax=Sphingomonas radiodurans TaxID=2890321 RepID=UPI001E55F57F|nr:TspO/MBR family protein [Sphingomonas radiodurans]WBH16997.1 tryptophan-rich sensory protein [Sphingomonas radiodurans]